MKRLMVLSLTLLLLAGCGREFDPTDQEQLEVFASRYASAWSRQDPHRFASFYAEDGVLQINDDPPAVGREAIATLAGAYMEAFPNMAVEKQSVEYDGTIATFRWHWTGTNTGPGGTGRAVDMTGYEEWTFDSEGKIARSHGHLDMEEYARQMGPDD